jgi:hypothetical protein
MLHVSDSESIILSQYVESRDNIAFNTGTNYEQCTITHLREHFNETLNLQGKNNLI